MLDLLPVILLRAAITTRPPKISILQGRAEGVQLSRLLALTNQPGLATVTGTANFNAHIAGNLSESDFSDYQITFDGEGKDVVINGRPAGTLALVGRTENKQLNITLTTGMLGPTPQSVAAQVNLASERLAANVETTLNNADLTSILAMVLPQAGVKLSGRATGTLKATRQSCLTKMATFPPGSAGHCRVLGAQLQS